MKRKSPLSYTGTLQIMKILIYWKVLVRQRINQGVGSDHAETT